jgi:hypothetical protein
MLVAVLVRHRFAIREVLFKGWVDDKFLSVGMTGKLPSELVLVSRLLVFVDRVNDFVVVLLQLPVVFLDSVRDASHVGDLKTADKGLLFYKVGRERWETLWYA